MGKKDRIKQGKKAAKELVGGGASAAQSSVGRYSVTEPDLSLCSHEQKVFISETASNTKLEPFTIVPGFNGEGWICRLPTDHEGPPVIMSDSSMPKDRFAKAVFALQTTYIAKQITDNRDFIASAFTGASIVHQRTEAQKRIADNVDSATTASRETTVTSTSGKPCVFVCSRIKRLMADGLHDYLDIDGKTAYTSASQIVPIYQMALRANANDPKFTKLDADTLSFFTSAPSTTSSRWVTLSNDTTAKYFLEDFGLDVRSGFIASGVPRIFKKRVGLSGYAGRLADGLGSQIQADFPGIDVRVVDHGSFISLTKDSSNVDADSCGVPVSMKNANGTDITARAASENEVLLATD